MSTRIRALYHGGPRLDLLRHFLSTHFRIITIASIAIVLVVVSTFLAYRRHTESSDAHTFQSCDEIISISQVASILGTTPSQGHRFFYGSTDDIFNCEFNFDPGMVVASLVRRPTGIQVSEATLLSYRSEPGFNIDDVDLGLGGRAYFLAPGLEAGNVRASCVWYASSRNILSVDIGLSAEVLPDDRLQEASCSLLVHIANSYSNEYGDLLQTDFDTSQKIDRE